MINLKDDRFAVDNHFRLIHGRHSVFIGFDPKIFQFEFVRQP